MPLSKAKLEQELGKFFSKPPTTAAGCGKAWADAVAAYASDLTPPSSAVTAAAGVLEGSLTAAFSGPPGGAPPLMELAFATFGLAVGVGMLPLVAVPPSAPVGFVAMAAAPHPKTAQATAKRIADLIHDWITTGNANTGPPTAPIPWT